jgi:hypothetical protein
VPHPRVSSYTVNTDGRTLTVEYAVGVCPAADYSAAAKESDASVTVVVSAYNIQQMDPGTACIEIAKILHSTVRLQTPLGARTVRDEGGTAVAKG